MRANLDMLTAPARWSWEARMSFAGVALVTVLVMTWLYLGFPVFVLPAILGVGALAALTLRQPIIGVLAVVTAQYFPYGIGGFTFFQILGAFVTVLCFVYFGLTRRGMTFSWIVVPIVAFMLLTMDSLSFTHDPALTQYLIRKMIYNACFCLLLIQVVDDFRKYRWLLWAVAGTGVLNSLVAGLQFVTGVTVESRAKGLQENENQLGEIAALGLIIAVYAFLYADRWWKQLLALLACAALSIGLITSISRGAVISVLAGLAWAAIWETRHRKRFVVFAILAALAWPLLPDSFFYRFRDLNTAVRGTVVLSERVGLSSRGYYNKAGLKIWRAHPVFGVGLGNYGFYVIQTEFNPGIRASRKLPPHNLYIQALAETGIVGFAVLCWWILLAGFNYWRAEKQKLRDPTERGLLRASETLTIVALVYYFSSGNLVYTNFTMVMTLSFLCRRCVEKRALTSRSSKVSETLVPAPG